MERFRVYDKWPEKITRPTLEKMMNVVNNKMGKYIEEHLLLGCKKARNGITHGLKTSGGLKDENDFIASSCNLFWCISEQSHR